MNNNFPICVCTIAGIKLNVKDVNSTNYIKISNIVEKGSLIDKGRNKGHIAEESSITFSGNVNDVLEILNSKPQLINESDYFRRNYSLKYWGMM